MFRYFLVLLWLAGSAAYAEETPVVSVRLAGSAIEVNSSIMLPVQPCEAYALLTAYDELPQFIPGLLHSQYQRIAPHKVRVMQTGKVQVFIFQVRMQSLLEMDEVPDQRILFNQVAGDFVSYGGAWSFSQSGDGTLLAYQATLSFKPYVPLLLARSILEQDVKQKFAAIAHEAGIRKSRGKLQCKDANR